MATFSPQFGTKKTGDKKGLSTLEATLDIMMPFSRLRPFVITENSTTTQVQADATLLLTPGTNSITIGQAAYKGCELKIINEAGNKVTILDGIYTIDIEAGDTVETRWNGTDWRVKTDLHVGDEYIQYPDKKSPDERRFEGTWVDWSSRAIMYGVSTTSIPPDANYYDLVNTSITIGQTPTVLYHKNGDDYRLYKFKAQAEAYTVPDELDPVKWDYIVPDVIDTRKNCGNLLTDTDLAIGYQIQTGVHAGKYVTEVIVPGGKFWGVEGGFRPTFVSGGVQGSRIMNFKGAFDGFNFTSNS
ncbi:MAG: hypothetical protein LBT43_06515, partial [Prevotella sp.]|nr:hypothetical protein [Prevotella sp.]